MGWQDPGDSIVVIPKPERLSGSQDLIFEYPEGAAAAVCRERATQEQWRKWNLHRVGFNMWGHPSRREMER